MGGNLLHHFNLPPKRISRKEYEALSQRLIEEVSKHYPGRFAVLESYRNKQDFGDIDCLIETHESVRLDKWIQERFGVKPYVNGKTYDKTTRKSTALAVGVFQFPNECVVY